jgi:hypothetical protein
VFNYILFDSSQRVRFHQRLQQWGVLYSSLFDGHAEETLPELAPLLIDVSIESETTRKVIEETTRIGQLKPCVSKLEANLPLFPLTEQLAAFHLVSMPNGKDMLMRWYDTRILPVWLDVLHPVQRAYFARGITRWVSIDRFGIEQEHDISIPDGCQPSNMHAPLRLDEHQAARLLTHAEPDALIHQLRKTHCEYIGSIPPRTLHTFVETYWQMARKHGLNEQTDQLDLLQLAFYTSGRFIDNRLVSERLALHASEHDEPFAEWINTLPDSLWSLGMPLWERPDHDPSVV